MSEKEYSPILTLQRGGGCSRRIEKLCKIRLAAIKKSTKNRAFVREELK